MHPVVAATICCLLKSNGRVLWSPAADQLNGSKSGQWVIVADACFISAADRPSKPVMRVQAGWPAPGRYPWANLAGTASGCNRQCQETFFSPAVLRKALRQAGNVVAPCDVPEVLQYVISDRQYAGFDKLHLVLLYDGSVRQLRYGPAPSGNQPKEKAVLHVVQAQIQRAV
ncbi:TPA: hypothetical protein ACH3X1_013198 [Trebouxia sp. C0004]